MPNVGQELLNVPFSEMTLKLALAIADGQTKLDMNSAQVAKFMADTNLVLPSVADPAQTTSLPILALGFFPGFYQFQEAIIEVKMAITMAVSTEVKASVTGTIGSKWTPYSASVNASYSSKYDYKVEGSSLLRVRIVPLPPPSILQDYMEALIKKMTQSAAAAGLLGPPPKKITITNPGTAGDAITVKVDVVTVGTAAVPASPTNTSVAAAVASAITAAASTNGGYKATSAAEVVTVTPPAGAADLPLSVITTGTVTATVS
jgi:hypothetical protein